MDLSFWIGRWWLTIWKSKTREVVIGLGDDLGVGNYGAFFIVNYRWRFAWIHVATPTLLYLQQEQRIKDTQK